MKRLRHFTRESTTRQNATRTLSRLACLTCAVLITACSAIPPLDLKAPEIAFNRFEVSSLGFENIGFALTVSAQNPNSVAIPIKDLNFDLNLLGEQFAVGQSREALVNLPAGATQDVKIDFVVPTNRLLKLVRSLETISLDKIGYALNGSASWGNSGFPLPFKRQGSLDVLRKFQEMLNPLLRSK